MIHLLTGLFDDLLETSSHSLENSYKSLETKIFIQEFQGFLGQL